MRRYNCPNCGDEMSRGYVQVGMRPLGEAPTITVERVTVSVLEDAVGTVRAAHETEVGAKIMARVLAIRRAGQIPCVYRVAGEHDD
ncbi:MAG: hypothetical protein KAY37_15970 [Phycisphaerae bacterium]|nr:hypothetical protein [Phycisphaerae bacterium]